MMGPAAVMLLGALAGSAAAENPNAPVTLPKGVLVATDASAAERYAAEDLLSNLAAVAGSSMRPALCNTTQPCFDRSASSWWAVGLGAARAVGLADSALEGLGLEGYVVAMGQNGSVAVTGGAESARGALYAVNHALRALGYEWYAHDVTLVPTALPPTLPPALLSRHVPTLEYRQQYQFQCLANDPAGERYAKFESHLGQNRGSRTLAADARFGGTLEYALEFVHTSYDVLAYPAGASRQPPAHLWAAHREWFWPQTDNGSTTYGQLCWSDPSLQAFLVSQVRRILTDLPNATILSVSQNDNQNYCKTPAELAIIKEEGTPGGAMFRAINVIADAVADDFPRVAIDTLAYQWSRPAPNITVPRKNVIIRLCSIECNFGAPMTDPSNAAFQKDIGDWSKISDRLYIWNYITNFVQYLAPFPNWWVIGPNVRFFAEHGVRGVFQEGADAGPGSDMNELKDWVLSRMMWDPTLNDTELIGEFLAEYYGAAAPHVLDYMTTMHTAVASTGYYMRDFFDATHAPFMTPDVALRGAAAFAAALAEPLPAAVASRVLESSMAMYWVVMPRWAELTAYAAGHNVSWPLEKTLVGAFDGTFTRAYNFTAQRYGAVPAFSIDNKGETLAQLRQSLIG